MKPQASKQKQNNAQLKYTNLFAKLKENVKMEKLLNCSLPKKKNIKLRKETDSNSSRSLKERNCSGMGWCSSVVWCSGTHYHDGNLWN